MQNIFRRYYMASVGWNYDGWISEAAKNRNVSIAEFSEPYLLPLLSTETTEFILDGIQYTRVQKTLSLPKYTLTKRFLNVCVKNEPHDKNCGVCPKCTRVGLTLSAIDGLDEYNDVFNIPAYKRKEYTLMCTAMKTRTSDLFMADIVDLARRVGKKYPRHFVAFLLGAYLFLRKQGQCIQGKIKALVGRRNVS